MNDVIVLSLELLLSHHQMSISTSMNRACCKISLLAMHHESQIQAPVMDHECSEMIRARTCG